MKLYNIYTKKLQHFALKSVAFEQKIIVFAQKLELLHEKVHHLHEKFTQIAPCGLKIAIYKMVSDVRFLFVPSHNLFFNFYRWCKILLFE